MISWSLGTSLKCHIVVIGEKKKNGQMCPHQSPVKIAIKFDAIGEQNRLVYHWLKVYICVALARFQPFSGAHDVHLMMMETDMVRLSLTSHSLKEACL